MALAPLDTTWIERELGAGAFGLPLQRFETTSSTSDEAKRASRAGLGHGACFVAEVQTEGRGRRGRSWAARPFESLLFSVLLDPPQLADPSPLTLAVGLGVHLALQPHVPVPLAVKWPNDIVSGRKKLAGILVETELSGSKPGAIVVGIGINVSSSDFPDDLAAIATSLELLGSPVARERVLVDVLRGIETWYWRFRNDGVMAVVNALERIDALRGVEVRIDGKVGRCSGFDRRGHLLLDSGGRMESIGAGTVEWLAT
jgi:BirA family transcriptional regulator, biotin operon repressor / biotin---[acetyl-CoA-carboxylase] ligase